MNKDIRKITDGAMMAAIVGVILWVDRFTGGTLVSMLLFLFPLPLLFYSAKYGWRDSLPVLAAVFFLLFIFGNFANIYFGTCASAVGIVYGDGVKKGNSSRKLMAKAIIGSILTEMLAFVFLASIAGYSLSNSVDEMQQMLQEVVSLVGEGQPSQTGDQLTQALGMFTNPSTMTTMVLNSTVLLGVMEGALTHAFSRIVLGRMRVKLPPGEPIYAHVPPKAAGYVALVFLLAYMLGFALAPVGSMAYNVIITIGMIALYYLSFYGVIGTTMFLRSRFRLSGGITVLLVIVLFFIMPLFLAFFGFFYITTDMRGSFMKEVAQ